MTDKEAFDTVNSFLPQAEHEVMVAYLTALGLLFLLLAVLAHVFAARRVAAVFVTAGALSLGFTVPSLAARVFACGILVMSGLTVWRESKHSQLN